MNHDINNPMSGVTFQNEPTMNPVKYQRRKRYRGTHPRRFHEKYKELDPHLDPNTVQKVIEAGKTPAGTHRPIMVKEILDFLNPLPGQIAVDATLGFGGHTSHLLPRILPTGRLLGIDTDPFELPKTEARLRSSFPVASSALMVCHSNFAALPRLMAEHQLPAADMILADLGCSSMQLDNPSRGFSFKQEGPLDLRMNPNKGLSATQWLAKVSEVDLIQVLKENADEPHAEVIAHSIWLIQSHTPIQTTQRLSQVVWNAMGQEKIKIEEKKDAIRRVFQAIRIAVNAEFQTLELFLRFIPSCLKPGGRVAILTFHSGEDRRVKYSFQKAFRQGDYSRIAEDVIRPSREEIHSNARASSAKLRWAIKRL